MKIRHPRDAGIAIDVDGDHVMPGDNGHYEIGDRRGWLEDYAGAHGCDPDELLVAETCDAVKADGEVCGRELPCPYHSDGEA
ncbi:hypothetical protein OSG_eHP31_00020 [environmental Halophage eHP-31]|nr:hypothetical protein OSG_eHP31_00020 [environmental Halophage eHP-31]